MENASKALIIAGAILLAIVIISLGLIVVNNTRSTIDNTNLSEQEIQNFNAKFVAYEGANVSGSRVNNLIQQVISTNQSLGNSGNDNFICIAFPSISGTSTYPYVWLGAYKGDSSTSKGEVSRSGTKSSLPSDIDVSDDVTNTSTIIGTRNYLKENKGTGTSSLSVQTGKNYTVKLTYHNGMVAGITVQ